MADDERESLYLPSFGLGSAQMLSEHRSRKRKHPIGFAPPKPKVVKRRKRK